MIAARGPRARARAELAQPIGESSDSQPRGVVETRGMPSEVTSPKAAPDAPRRPRRRSNAWWWIALDRCSPRSSTTGLGSRATQAPARVRVPYSPFFVAAGRERQRRGDHLEGHSDPGRLQTAGALRAAKATTMFETEIPAFADTNALAALARSASGSSSTPSRSRRACRGGRTCFLNFGPTVLFLGLLVLLMRRRSSCPEHSRLVLAARARGATRPAATG